ncbi:MAG TPA: NlpC/P60 family protein [Acidimicrobiales bacterium]|nr:NlpC/P60 family protein [Acidimicrobiales bacterium]
MSARLTLAVGSALLAGGAVLGLSVLAGSAADSSTPSAAAGLLAASEACAVHGAAAGLSPEQAANAEVVVSVAMADSGESALAARIALMTAYAESGLYNLGPRPGNDGSLGLFQQRAALGWGTPAEESDPAQATAMFTRRLTAVPGWSGLAPWAAAQEVQRSADPAGSNYAAAWPVAGAILTGVLADANAPGGCGQGIAAGLAGPAAAHGLPPGYAVPAGTPPDHARAVEVALGELGKAYVWGAAGPDAFDCSGLTAFAWAAAGVRLDHYSVDQAQEGAPVDPAEAVPGDLVLVPGSDPPGPGEPGHVGIYLGDGLVVSAIDPAHGVAVQTWSDFVGGGLDGVVDPAPGR